MEMSILIYYPHTGASICKARCKHDSSQKGEGERGENQLLEPFKEFDSIGRDE